MAIPADLRDLGGVPRGRAAYEIHCAQCHGPTAEGGYLSPSARPARIAGADAGKVAHQVRKGSEHMQAFSPAVLPDAALHDVITYVHETLARPGGEPTRFGIRELDPFLVGILVWVALAVFTYGLAALFREGRY